MPNTKQSSEFLTSEKMLQSRFEKRARQMAFASTTSVEAKAWQRKARRKLSQLLGLQHFEKCSPRAQKISSERVEDLTREEWRIQTEADVWLSFYLFIPDSLQENAPLIICPHGHASGGKLSTAGRWDIPEMVPVIKEYNYDYGVKLAQMGFITACPDARGFGQRREPAQQNDLLASSCANLQLAGAPLGLTVQGMWAWDLMRLLDFLQDDPRVDSKRIGCAGLSGGGLQTLNLAALDTRVKAAIVSGYFYGVRESLQVLNGNCACNLVPHLWENFDMGDIGAMIAPRGLFIETGDADPLNGASGVKNVKSQTKIARRAFTAYDAASQLKHHVFEGEHRWCGEKSLPWIGKQLCAESLAD